MVKYAIKKSGPAAEVIGSVDEAKMFKAKAEAVVLGCFGSATSDVAKTFLKVAGTNDDLIFGITTEKKVMKELGCKSDGLLVLKDYDEGKATLSVSGKTIAEEMSSFISNMSMRLVTTFTPELSRSIFGGPVKAHALTHLATCYLMQADAMLSEMAKVAAKQRGKSLHIHVDPSEERVLDFFGFSAADVPAVVLADMRGDLKKYNYSGDLSEAGLLQFESDFFSGKLSPTLKSQEATDDDLAKPVKVVKGTTFSSIVLDNKNDVLVEFYAPWCGHCKSLAPKYDELGAKFEEVPSVTIAKMDATANEVDVEGIAVQGFPTLFFFPGNNKSKPIKYEGAREVDDMAGFLLASASTSYSLDGKESGATGQEEL
ncbi:unnamed protein product [Chrysoparadoxa australica]